MQISTFVFFRKQPKNMKYKNIREEEIKNKVGQDFFADFDTTKIIGNVDFCATIKNKNPKQNTLFEAHSLLWAEAKTGDFDIFAMLICYYLVINCFQKDYPHLVR